MGIEALEVERPKRRRPSSRRHVKKSDPSDAERAARAVLADEASGVPKSGDGRVEMIRTLRAARRYEALDRSFKRVATSRSLCKEIEHTNAHTRLPG
jgi:hypothetical protein